MTGWLITVFTAGVACGGYGVSRWQAAGRTLDVILREAGRGDRP